MGVSRILQSWPWVRCVVAMQDENDYAISVSCIQSLFWSLIGKRPPEVSAENIAIVKNAFATNPRFEICRG